MEIMKQMIVLEDKINLGKVVFDDNNRTRISCYCLGQTCPNIFSFCWSSLGAFGEFTFTNFWRKNPLGWNFVQCGTILFTLTKIMNTIFSTKNRVFILLGGPSKTGKSQLLYKWLKIGTLQPKFDKLYFFLSTFPAPLRCYARGKWKPRVYARSKILNLLNR